MTDVLSNAEAISKMSLGVVQKQKGGLLPQSWLPSLQKSLKKLRQAYRNEHVDVDYTNPNIVSAYLLAYAPYHVFQTYEALERLSTKAKKQLCSQKELSVVGFCSGPGPEILALQWFLASNKAKCKHLHVCVYDDCAAGWEKHGNFSKVLLRGGPIKVSWKYKHCDINSYWLPDVDVSTADLIFLQNCSNEIDSHKTSFPALLKKMKSGAHFIYSDLSSYRKNIQLMRHFEAQLQGSHCVSELQYHHRDNFRYAPELERHLFCRKDELWARRCLKFATILFEKR